MKKIIPFKNAEEAIGVLDNGGRFYNMLTKEDDGKITAAEVGKLAGVFADKQQMVLFFDVAAVNLTEEEKALVVSKMSDGLQKTYAQHTTHAVDVDDKNQMPEVSKNFIVRGTPVLVDSQSALSGFIMIPVMIGKVMIFSMIPITDQYDIYEVRGENSSLNFLVAHASAKEKLPSGKIVIGGVIKTLSASREEKKPSGKFLEISYIVE